MLTIRIGNRKIKLLNWFIFIGTIILIIYLIGSLIFMLPMFKTNYEYKIIKENYVLNVKASFKNAWLKCNQKEEIVLSVSDKDIKKRLNQDLINDGYKIKDEKYISNVKTFGFCKDDRNEYKKIHSSKYASFKLNGEKEVTINYNDEYKEEYVTSLINQKENKNVIINSNLNENKVGTYIISYTLGISDNYKQRLYRKVNIVDKEKPDITLNGEEEIILDFNTKYLEPGFKAVDNYDGDLTNKVSIKNNVNEKKAGTYEITYKVKDSSGNVSVKKRKVIIKEKDVSVSKEKPNIEVKNGITYVDGIIIVNKTYSLPKDYDPKVNKDALKALKLMQADAKALGLDLSLISGYRSYNTQKELYNKYVKKDGEEVANTYSAKPGHSEHQTGLAFDIGSVDRSFANTSEAKWIEENAHLYGFIVRYPNGKTDITGYIYEPWHVRYLGKETAKKVWESGLTLEEYLGLN